MLRAVTTSQHGGYRTGASQFRLRFIVPSRRAGLIQRQIGAHTFHKEYRFNQSSA
jgi:hypothetical protein